MYRGIESVIYGYFCIYTIYNKQNLPVYADLEMEFFISRSNFLRANYMITCRLRAGQDMITRWLRAGQDMITRRLRAGQDMITRRLRACE